MGGGEARNAAAASLTLPGSRPKSTIEQFRTFDSHTCSSAEDEDQVVFGWGKQRPDRDGLG